MEILPFKEVLASAYQPVKPPEEKFNNFKEALKNFIEKTKISETEEHNKNLIPIFLKAFAYSERKYEINTVGKIDLAIVKDGYVEVLIEVKRPNNQNNQIPDMVKKDDMNKKAFHEALLYFMRQIDSGKNGRSNPYIKHIIITNNIEWFIIDSHYFLKLSKNKEIKKTYNEIDKNKTASDTSTKAFYEKVQEIIHKDGLLNDLEFVYIDFEHDYSNKELIEVYKIFTPRHLLKELGSNDSNTLNKKFYNELLYILGLEEIGEKKKLIQRKTKENRDNASLLENTILKLKTEFSIIDEHELFEIALELNITWLNRLLFLKLLEAKLLFMHKNSKRVKKFLTPTIVKNFDILNTLFFEVLAKELNDRDSVTIEEFKLIPYLNSSLFETTELEKKYLRISGLKDNLELEIYPSTKSGLKEKAYTLKYLLIFLGSYTFGAEVSDIVKKDNETLINSSVLGLIFEKINGYKDGSFFTPSFITMYMTKESIRKTVISKFNDEFKIEISTFEELKRFCMDRSFKDDFLVNANKVVDGLTIVDPAVGSGHFLVSALNELISIKSELTILKGLSGYEISNENDELYIKNKDGDFVYQQIKDGTFLDEAQRVQEAIFHEKQRIIEKQLFGVDINPNSVKITRLRLWIELLKSSYYKKGELVTLPNIDINIKCGNSLISKFPLDDKDNKNKLIKDKINEYKSLVKIYMSENNKVTKQEIKDKIEELKKGFKEGLHEFSPTMLKFKEALKEYVSNYRYEGLTEELILLAVNSNHGFLPGFFDDDKTIKKAKAETKKKMLAKLEKKYETIKEFQNNEIYKNSFEWRFQFPEVLNNEGDFVGFDIVIMNPPYISAKNMSAQNNKVRAYLKNNYNFLVGKWDIYIAFIEKSLKIVNMKGIISMIIPNAFVSEHYSNRIREHLIKKKLVDFVNFYEYDIFENATVRNIILTLNLSKNELPKQRIYKTILDFTEVDINTEDIFKSQHNQIGRLLKSELYLGDICFISKGMVLHANQRIAKGSFVKSDLVCNIKDELHTKRYTEGKWIDRYSIKTIKYLEWNTNRVPSQISRPTFIELYENNKILINKLGRMKAVYDSSNILCDQTIRVLVRYIDLKEVHNRSIQSSIKKFSNYGREKLETISSNFNLKYILSLLNSSLYSYILDLLRTNESFDLNPLILRKLPIPNISKQDQKPFIELVDKILELKEQNAETSDLEKKIDQMVYELYDLTKEEIGLVDPDRVEI